MLFVLVVTSFCCLPLLLGLVLWLVSRKYSHLPNELGSPIFGNLIKVFQSCRRLDPDELHEWAEKLMEERSTDTFVVWNGPMPIVITADPAIVEKLYNNPAAMDKEPYVYDILTDQSFGAFSHAISDSYWRHHRKSMLKSFTPIKLKKYHEVFVKRCLELNKMLEKQKGVFNISPFLVLSTADIILETHFGLDLELLESQDIAFAEDVRRSFQSYADVVINPFAKLLPSCLLPVEMSEKIKKFHMKCVEGVMKNTKEGKMNGDRPYAEELLEHCIESGMNFETIDKEMRDIYYEGAYLIARVTSFASLFLAIHPEVQTKAWEEQLNIMQEPSKTPTYDDIKKMEYLERIIMETIRLVSPPMIARRLREELCVGSIRVPKNVCFVIFTLSMRKNPKYWENPTGFDPDHFLPEKVQERPKAMSFFGIAPRNCPGGRFGINQAKVILSSLIRGFELSSPLKPQDVKYRAGLFMDLRGDYSVRLKPRLQVHSD